MTTTTTSVWVHFEVVKGGHGPIGNPCKRRVGNESLSGGRKEKGQEPTADLKDSYISPPLLLTHTHAYTSFLTYIWPRLRISGSQRGRR